MTKWFTSDWHLGHKNRYNMLLVRANHTRRLQTTPKQEKTTTDKETVKWLIKPNLL